MTLAPRPSDAELLERARQQTYHAQQRANAAENERANVSRVPANPEQFKRDEAMRDVKLARVIQPGPNAIVSAIASEKPKRPPRNDDPEHREQVEFFRRIDKEGYDLPELRQCYAVPNGTKRGKLTRWKLKQEGVRAGELDINLDLARGGFFGLRLEMKAAGGNASTLQRERILQHIANGYAAEVVYGADDAERVARAYVQLPQTKIAR